MSYYALKAGVAVTGVSRCGLTGSALPPTFPAKPYPLKAMKKLLLRDRSEHVEAFGR